MPCCCSWRSTRRHISAALASTTGSGSSTFALATAASSAACAEALGDLALEDLADLAGDVVAKLVEGVELGGLGGEVVVELG